MDTHSQVILPTLASAQWTIASFRDSFLKQLTQDSTGEHLRLYFYAITVRGWEQVRSHIAGWMKNRKGKCAVYVGTDHGLTEPAALASIRHAGATVNVLIEYTGTFHPKLAWLDSGASHSLWIGSNNLTEDGLAHNIELGSLIKCNVLPADFTRWIQHIEKASTPLTDALLRSYERERNAYAEKQAQLGAFTWSQRREPPPPPAPPPPPTPPSRTTKTKAPATPATVDERPLLSARSGDLILEVMPLETGSGGKQMQLPMDAAVDFFGLPRRVGASSNVTLRSLVSGDVRVLTMTIFGNRTVRLSLNDLDYSDRPCVIVFRKTGIARFDYRIVQRAIFPSRYSELLGRCNRATREGSRQWAIIR